MAYVDFKDLPRRTAFDKVLRDNTHNTAKNLKYDGHQRELVSMVFNFFDKNSTVANTSDVAIKSRIMSNQQLAEELNKM